MTRYSVVLFKSSGTYLGFDIFSNICLNKEDKTTTFRMTRLHCGKKIN